MKMIKISSFYSLAVCIVSFLLVIAEASSEVPVTALSSSLSSAKIDDKSLDMIKMTTKVTHRRLQKGDKEKKGDDGGDGDEEKGGIDIVSNKDANRRHHPNENEKKEKGHEMAKEMKRRMKNGQRFDAGGGKGKVKGNNVEKFKALQQKRRQQIEADKKNNQKQHKGGLLQKAKDKNMDMNGVVLNAIDKETGETSKMKAFRKGTPEFDERINKIKSTKEERKKVHVGVGKKATRAANQIFKGKIPNGITTKEKGMQQQRSNVLKKFGAHKEKGVQQKQLSNSGNMLQKFGTPLEKKNFGGFEASSKAGTKGGEGLEAIKSDRSFPFKKKLAKPGKYLERLENTPFIGKRLYKLNDEEELILDASLAFIKSLKHGTLFPTTDDKKKTAPLSLKKKDGLHKWLQLLSVSLPPEWSLHTLIDDLINNIDIISASEEKLKYILNQYDFPRKNFSRSCVLPKKERAKKKKNRRMTNLQSANEKNGEFPSKKRGFTFLKKGDELKNYNPGFHCGFWKLLHLITIGVAEHRGGITLVENGIIQSGGDTAMSPEEQLITGGAGASAMAMISSTPYRIFSPLQAADTIRDFIDHFYSCEVCKEKFIKLYDNCDNHLRCVRLIANIDTASGTNTATDTYDSEGGDGDDVLSSPNTESSSNSITGKDWQELAKWMWEFHNEFNVILMHEHNDEMQEDYFLTMGADIEVPVKEEYIEAIWPSMSNCFLCFHDDGEWNYDAIFLFLEKTYWLGAEFDEQADKLLKFDFEDGFYEDFYYYSAEEGSELVYMWMVTIIILIVLYSAITKNSSSHVALRLKQYQLKAKLLQQNVLQETTKLAASVVATTGGPTMTEPTRATGKRSD